MKLNCLFLNKAMFSVILMLTLFSCQVGSLVVYNFADIQDHKKFPARTIEKAQQSFQFQSIEYGKYQNATIREKDKPHKPLSFDEYLEKHKTVAFLIIKDDTIQYENYFKGYDQEAVVPSFSMAKSVTSLLIGCALDDGLINSINDPVTAYLPELEDQGFSEVRIKHLLQMTAGIKFNESYLNPFGHAATFYYGKDLRKSVNRLKLKEAPGTSFDYISGSTQVLGCVLEAALNGQTISNYLQEKIWIPLQMEYDASWSIDHKNDGIEKTFCCLNARARDFAKIGRLYLNNGQWNGKQVVSEQWIKASTQVETTEGSVRYYQYQWWLPYPDGSYGAQGILGQYIYVNPKKNLIIVRLGKNEGKMDWWGFFSELSGMY